MKILFMCSSLEPGRDGVGDYTRKLSSELTLQGHLTALVALNDKHISEKYSGIQQLGGVDLPVLRLPSLLTQKERFSEAKIFIESWNPDWLSLQYVVYGFHPKGLPFKLGSELALIGQGRQWNIMFHEIWLGESKTDSLKHRILGAFQKKIIKKTVKRIKPKSILTSNNYYKQALAKNKIFAEVIPIFSGLPVGNSMGKSLIDLLPPQIQNNRRKYIIASFFGTLHYSDSLYNGFSRLQEMAKQADKNLVITHVGNDKSINELWKYIELYPGDFTYAFGQQPGQDIADYFSQIDIGLSTYPKTLFEKSSSISCMLNNNLPVILLRENFEPDDMKIPYIQEIETLTNIEDFISISKDFGNNFLASDSAAKYSQMLVLD